MNIRLELENEHFKNKMNEIASYACSTPGRFRKLMDCFFDPDHRMVLAASWIISKSVEIQNGILDPFLPKIVAQLTNPHTKKHLIRNSLRILELIEIPETLHGLIMNACFDFLQEPKTEIAIKAYSMTIIYQLSLLYPEIQEELKCIIEEKWDQESPAFKSRGRKIIAQIIKSRKQKRSFCGLE
jgi:hypothetical protein